MLKLTCPIVKDQPIRERYCKLCKHPGVTIHQTITKSLKDSVVKHVILLRMFCKFCHYTFRVYPEGVRAYSGRTKRLVFMGILLYTAGLSYEKVVLFLTALLGKEVETAITIWRDIQSLGEKLRRHHFGLFKKGEHVVAGIDGCYFMVQGKELCILFSVDALDNATILFEAKREENYEDVKTFITLVRKTCDVLGITTDDWELYKEPLELKRIPHQICLAHVKKNFKKHIRGLPKSVPVRFTETVTTLIDTFSPTGLLTLEEIIMDPYLRSRKEGSTKTREILADLLRKWKQYTEYWHTPILPKTNNHTERAIGRSKIRYYQTRGLKSKEGLLNFIAVTQIFGEHKYNLLKAYC